MRRAIRHNGCEKADNALLQELLEFWRKFDHIFTSLFF